MSDNGDDDSSCKDFVIQLSSDHEIPAADFDHDVYNPLEPLPVFDGDDDSSCKDFVIQLSPDPAADFDHDVYVNPLEPLPVFGGDDDLREAFVISPICEVPAAKVEDYDEYNLFLISYALGHDLEMLTECLRVILRRDFPGAFEIPYVDGHLKDRSKPLEQMDFSAVLFLVQNLLVREAKSHLKSEVASLPTFEDSDKSPFELLQDLRFVHSVSGFRHHVAHQRKVTKASCATFMSEIKNVAVVAGIDWHTLHCAKMFTEQGAKVIGELTILLNTI